jgi:hypothetical protein
MRLGSFMPTSPSLRWPVLFKSARCYVGLMSGPELDDEIDWEPSGETLDGARSGCSVVTLIL